MSVAIVDDQAALAGPEKGLNARRIELGRDSRGPDDVALYTAPDYSENS